MAEKFSTAAILSVLGEHLLCDIGDVYKILNFMTGDNLYTHQLPRAARECRPHIVQQHPDLASFKSDGTTPENWKDRLANWTVEYGFTREIAPIPPEDHEWIDPLSELVEKIHPDRIIVIEGGTDG